MPQFRETSAIFTDQKTNIFDKDWDIVNKPAFFPPNSDWDYQRDMMIEDVNIWEVILEQSHGISLYAAWDPYAEFYMIVDGVSMSVEYFYGSKSSQKVFKRMKELGQNLAVSKAWVEPEDMWLYS
jgi:hypothetical protein